MPFLMKTKFTLLLLLTFTFRLLPAQNPAPFTDGSKWGYCNAEKQIVIPLKFYSCKPFNEFGLAVAEKSKDDYCIIDIHGKEVLPLGDVDQIIQVTADVAVVRKSVYNDKHTLYLIPERRALDIEFSYIGNFSQGKAAVRTKEKSGFITTKGEPWLMGKFDHTSSFSEGLALVMKGKKYGYINTEGKVAIPFQYEDAFDFSEGLARVRMEGKTGYIDKTGRIVIPCQYDNIHFARGHFKDGMVTVELNKHFGALDPTGKILIPIEYESLFYKGEGVYEAEKNGEELLIDRNGKVISKNTYKYYSWFSEGWVKVETDSMENFVDREGRFLMPFLRKFVVLDDFENGYALCRWKGTSFFIDTKGAIYSSGLSVPLEGMDPEVYPRLAGYEIVEGYNGLIIVKKSGLFSILDKSGNKALPASFMSWKIVTDKNFLALKDEKGKYSFYQGNLVPVVPEVDKLLQQAATLEDLTIWHKAFQDSIPLQRKTKNIRVGRQVWAAEDLKVTKFRNGDPIFVAPWPDDFIKATVKKIPAIYIGQPDDLTTWTKEGTYMYNRYAVTDKRGLIPDGYRLPDSSDWRKLVNYAFGDSEAMSILPQIGFRNLGYFIVMDGGGGFTPNTNISTWWCSEQSGPDFSITTMFISAFGGVVKFNGLSNESGAPIRCIFDISD